MALFESPKKKTDVPQTRTEQY